MFEDIILTTKGKVVFSGLFLLLVIPLAVYGLSLAQTREQELSSLQAPTVLDASSVEFENLGDIVDRVRSHIVLPEGEEPEIARVSDATKLQNKELFKNAKEGDYVLLYQQARKVIIYRSGEDKVIDVLSLTVRDSTQSISEIQTPTQIPLPSLINEDPQVDAATPSGF